MRIYRNFKEANNELRRDVAELGILVHPQTMQDKDIKDDPEFLTREYPNMVYEVTSPRVEDLSPSQPWADAEFAERLTFTDQQDGEAWKLRPEVWEEFSGDFAYSYGERYALSIDEIIRELSKHPASRQLFLAVWDPFIDSSRLGERRVPCSLGYWFALRNGALNITYLQRSADLATHLQNDQYLSHRLQKHIAERLGVEIGHFTHWIGSLHVYRKDVADVF